MVHQVCASTAVRCGSLAVSVLAATAVLLPGVLSPLGTSGARGADVVTFLVNTVEAGTPDANLGDTVCATAESKKCSLRAAIENANQVAAGKTVVVEMDPSFAGGTIEMPGSTTSYMVSTATPIAPRNTRAYFHITRTMTVNLADKIHVNTKALGDAAAFWVDAPNVQLQNFTDIYSNETSIVFSPNSDGSSLDGGESIEPAGYYPVNMIMIRPGADNIAIKNYSMGLFPRFGDAEDGMVQVTAETLSNDPTGLADLPVKNLTLFKVTFDNTPSIPGSTACDATSASGCDAEPIRFAGNVKVQTLLIDTCTFTNLARERSALDFANAGAGSDWIIQNSTFTKARGGLAVEYPVVQMPDGYPGSHQPSRVLTGTNYIRNNTFDNSMALGQQGFAIRWRGPYVTDNNTNKSNMYIENNTFNGYDYSSIMLVYTGTVTVRQNTFGTDSASQTNPELEETVGGAYGANKRTLLLNYDAKSNRRVLTWYPTAATVQQDCTLKVAATPPAATTGYGVAGAPVTLDFYYTVERTAEVYLGSVTTGKATTATFTDLPASPGYIRLQTQGSISGGQPESSQFSRTVRYDGPGKCYTPEVSVTLNAWQGLDEAGDNLTYDTILASDDAIEIPASSLLVESEPVWFTYTVENTGGLTLTDVVVRDSDQDPVCTIEKIERNGSAGCARRLDRVASVPPPPEPDE
jgi:adhesin/invasin